MGFETVGSIADFLAATFADIPEGVSGNMVAIVDMNRQHVENFTGVNIGSNSIQEEYEPPIINLSKADLIDYQNAQAGDNLQLGELKISENNDSSSAKFWRDLAESQLNALGRKVSFTRSISC